MQKRCSPSTASQSNAPAGYGAGHGTTHNSGHIQSISSRVCSRA